MTKAVAFDLDGTLAESKQPITPTMSAALTKLLAKLPVAIMSGDSWAHFQIKLLSELPHAAPLSNLYLFPTNAGECYEHTNGAWKLAYSHTFSIEERNLILGRLHEALTDVGLLQAPKETWGDRIEDRGSQISFSPLGQDAPVTAKEEWRAQFGEKRIALWQTLSKLLPTLDVKMGGITTIDIVHKDITKAYGMRKFSEFTHIPIPELLYVGDALGEGGNDAVVKETNVATRQVRGPEESLRIIEELLQHP